MAWTKTKSGEKADQVVITLSEEALNSSSKELSIDDVGEAGFLELLSVRVEFTATATAGTRNLVFNVLAASDDDALHHLYIDSNTLTASQTKIWEMYPNAPTVVTTPAQYVDLRRGIFIFPGQKLEIKDSAAIDAAADDMIIHVMAKVTYAKAV